MNRKLETFIKVLVGASFFIPLVVLPSSYIFPFIVPKIVWFRSLSLLMFGAYLVLLCSNWKKYRPNLSFLNIAVFLFLVSLTVSTFVGVDWYKSFWDNHERMLGLFTIFHFILYYFVVSSTIREWVDWKWLFRVFLLAGSIVMLLGLLQKANPEFLLNRGADRVSATLGNAIYFSGYGLFLFFVGLLLFLKENTRFWKYFSAIGGLLGLWGIFGGGTRGTLLGLIAGIIVMAVVYSVVLKEHKKVRIGLAAGLLGLVVIGGVLFAFRGNKFVQSIPAVGRLVTTTYDNKAPRFMAWEIAVEAWKEKPVFGWGPNNYYYAFNKYYRPEFLEAGWGETWFDNAHNIILNTLAVQGIVGIILYVGLFGVGFLLLVRAYRRGDIDYHVLAIASAFLVGHFVHNITVFENPTSYLYFFFFLSFISQMTVNKEQLMDDKEQRTKNKEQKVGRYKQEGNVSTGLAVVVGLVVLLVIYGTDVNAARANKQSLQALKYLQTDASQAFSSYDNALSIPSPHRDDIVFDFTRVYMEQFNNLNKSGKNTKDMLAKVISDLDGNKKLHPLDIRTNVQASQMYSLKSQIDGNKTLLIQSEKELTDALVLSPRRQQLQYSLAAIEVQLSKYDEAVKLLKESINNDDKIGEGWWRLALTYESMGRIDDARSTMLEARQKGIVLDSRGKDVEKRFLGEIIDEKI